MHLLLLRSSHAALFNACRLIWLKHQAVFCTVWYHVRPVVTVALEIDRLNGPLVLLCELAAMGQWGSAKGIKMSDLVFWEGSNLQS